MTFDEFCDKNGIGWWRNAFYHDIMMRNVNPQTEEEFSALWADFRNEALKNCERRSIA